MKTTELQIGDLVDYRGKVIEVTSLYAKNGSNEIGFTDKEETWVDGSVIEPIPLTPEILEKNGFILRKRYFYLISDDESFAIGVHRNTFLIGEFFEEDDFHWFIETPYVHQLQHAFRLYGIDKEITL